MIRLRHHGLTAFLTAVTGVLVLVPIAGTAEAGSRGASIGAEALSARSAQSANSAVLRERQHDFVTAAREWGVPESVLLAVSYEKTRWDVHAGRPSLAGGFGPMHLTDVSAREDARGDSVRSHQPASGLGGTLQRAARLLNLPATALRENPRQNIRGGAALLAAAGRQLSGGALPNSTGGWYAAVAESSGSSELLSAQGFADDVYARLRAGASRSTDDGRIVQLRGEPAVHPDRTLIAALHLAKPRPSSVECPANVDCSFLPAAYAQNSVDKGDYGNYDQAKRPTDLKINYIVIHDTEGSFQGTLDTFTDPTSLVATHYVVRSSDGHVTQMVPTKNVPFHAGNWYFNMHSIGIEHEGIAESGGTWYTEAMYRSSARLVRYLAHRFQIPLDRQHILGHDNVPGIDPAHIADMHWDPAVYWDWSHYLSLLGAPIRGHGGEHSAMVTINPNFQTNQPAVSGCDGVKNLPVQGSSAVYLHTGPSGTAPLLSDHALHLDGAQGTTRICDWGDRASTGQQFMVAGRDGDWTAIWYGGQKAWFENPARHPTAVSARGLAVRARPGRTSVPVYGRAYPEAAAYPGSIPVQPVTPLGYSVAAGQSYVLGEPTGSDYYYAKTVDSSLPDDHTVVSGTDRYYEIQLGYRVAYVRSADVMVVPAR